MSGDLEKLSEILLDIIDDHIVFLDSDCKVLHMNKVAKKQFKIGRLGLVGNNCTDYCKFKDYNIGECPAKTAKRIKKKQTVDIKIGDGSIYQIVVYPIIENKKI